MKIIVSMILGFLVICGCGKADRYIVTKGDNGVVYRTDRKTGETVMIKGITMKPVKEYVPPVEEKTFELNQNQLSKLGGRGGRDGNGSNRFSATIYNGNTDINLRSVIIGLTHIDKNGNRYDRFYSCSPAYGNCSALKTCDLHFEFIRGEEPSDYSYPWFIKSATGVSAK